MNILKGIKKREIFFILVFEIGFGLKFNLIGEISVSELFLVYYFITHFFNDPIYTNRDFKYVRNLYFLLFMAQCISELMVHNYINNALKGISVTIISFFHLYFLVKMFMKNRKLVPWALLGMLLQGFIWGSDIGGDASEALSGEDATFLKFYVAPIVINVLLFYSLMRPKKTTCILFMYCGAFFIVAGARSSGGMVFIAGLLSWIIASGRKISKMSLYRYGFLVLVLGYASYTIYVNKVLTGEIKSGNNEQLFRAKNPYNLVNLLMVGRSETFVGFQAFMDKPVWGYGSWKLDSEVGYKYTILRAKIQNADPKKKIIFIESDRIPCHSVIVGWGTYNGIFAFTAGLLIILYIYKRGFMALAKFNSMSVLLVFCLLQGSWHAAFSPSSHFRYTLPFYMALSLVCYWQTQHNNVHNIRRL